MTAEEIVTAIQRLPAVERDKVIEFARGRLQGQLTGEEFGEPANHLGNSLDKQEPATSNMHGLYGNVAPLA
jgi:hypothetical protein